MPSGFSARIFAGDGGLVLELNHVGGRETQAAKEQRRQGKFFLQQHWKTVMQEAAFDKQRQPVGCFAVASSLRLE